MKPLEKWHAHLAGELEGGLDALLADDVVFYSPVVFTPLHGKDLAKLYLSAAGNTFGDAEKEEPEGGKFRYTKEVCDGNQMVLEFESMLDGKYINGVDIISWNDAGQIIEFKVMLRPLQAVNAMHARMKAMLESMQSA